MRKEELDKKQDELADELCALLERAGRGGASSRVFEIPEYARRRIDVSPSKGKMTGHFKGLVISDWKRKDHAEGDTPEARMTAEDLLRGVATFLEEQGLSVYVDPKGGLYVLGVERYNGIPVEGYETGHLYKLYVAEQTKDAYTIYADGAPIVQKKARLDGRRLQLRGWFRAIELRPYEHSEGEYVKEMREKAEGGK